MWLMQLSPIVTSKSSSAMSVVLLAGDPLPLRHTRVYVKRKNGSLHLVHATALLLGCWLLSANISESCVGAICSWSHPSRCDKDQRSGGTLADALYSFIVCPTFLLCVSSVDGVKEQYSMTAGHEIMSE